MPTIHAISVRHHGLHMHAWVYYLLHNLSPYHPINTPDLRKREMPMIYMYIIEHTAKTLFEWSPMLFSFETFFKSLTSLHEVLRKQLPLARTRRFNQTFIPAMSNFFPFCTCYFHSLSSYIRFYSRFSRSIYRYVLTLVHLLVLWLLAYILVQYIVVYTIVIPNLPSL